MDLKVTITAKIFDDGYSGVTTEAISSEIQATLDGFELWVAGADDPIALSRVRVSVTPA